MFNKKNDVCCYFSPECEGQTQSNCGYWDGSCLCPMMGTAHEVSPKRQDACDGPDGVCPHNATQGSTCRDMCGLGVDDAFEVEPYDSDEAYTMEDDTVYEHLPICLECGEDIENHEEDCTLGNHVCEICEVKGGMHTEGCASQDCPSCGGGFGSHTDHCTLSVEMSEEYMRQSVKYCIDCGADKHRGETCEEARMHDLAEDFAYNCPRPDHECIGLCDCGKEADVKLGGMVRCDACLEKDYKEDEISEEDIPF